MTDTHVRHACHRRGTALIEVAFVLPVFLVFMFGLIAYGHAVMVSNMLKGAARSAARFGAAEGVSSAEAEARLRNILAGGMNSTLATVQIKDASAYDNGGAFPLTASSMSALPNLELSNAETRQLFLVRATINYNQVAIIPVPGFETLQLSGQAFMRHE